MFYAHFVLAKKGPLARIWLAAHWDKKLTKAHVFETNIEKSVEGILQPKVKMALRTSGHLLLGVVRIYSRKAKYLLADCNEAFVKIKMAFRPGMVDLPEDIREAAVSAITFPEVFHDFDTPMPELNDVDIQAQFSLNQSRAEEITMREDYGNISLVTGDDGFGDMGFEEPPELMRGQSSIDHNLDQTNLIFVDDDLEKDKDDHVTLKDQSSRLSVARSTSVLDLEAPMRDDGFGGNLGQDIIAGGLFEGGLFDDTPVVLEEKLSDNPLPMAPKIQDDSDDDGADLDRFGGPPSVDPPSSDGGSPCPSPRPEARTDEAAKQVDEPPAAEESVAAPPDQTTLLHNEEESFALAPVDSSAIKSGWPRIKRKRKLIVDEVKNISGEEMKSQLSDTTDIVTTLDLAPPSKRLMHWKETGGVEKLFALPGRSIPASVMSEMYLRNLTSEYCVNEDFGMAGDKELENLRLEQVDDDPPPPLPPPVEPLPTRGRGRPPKRKHEEEEEEDIPNQPIRDFNALLSPEQLAQVEPAKVPAEEPVPTAEVSVETSATEEPIAPQPIDPVEPMDTTEAPASVALQDVGDGAADMRSPDLASPPPVMPEMENVEAAQPEATKQNPEPLANEPSMADLASPLPIDHMEHDDAPRPIDVPENDDVGTEPLSPPPVAAQPTENASGNEPIKHEIEDEYEEQAEDETYEEFEERVVNKRAAAMFLSMKKTLRSSDIYFNGLILGNNRKQVAQKFYTCLVLKKLNAVELEQEDGPYGAITIKRGIQFDKAKL